VSPPFALSFGEDFPLTYFKLMIHSDCKDITQGGQSVSKSAWSVIKLKCDSTPVEFQANINFTIAVGNEQRGPVSHNFSSAPIGELPASQRVWNLNGAVDFLSMTVLICLEALPCADILPATFEDANDGGKFGIAAESVTSWSSDAKQFSNLSNGARIATTERIVEQPVANAPRRRCRSEAGWLRQIARSSARWQSHRARRAID